MSQPQPSPQDLAQIAVLIPALEPGPALPALVTALLSRGFGHVLVIDDGSSAAGQAVFEQLPTDQRLVVLRHAVNCGKGRALKTAFNHCLVRLPGLLGVVTADADGQHSVEDIVRVALRMRDTVERGGTSLVLGVREFDPGVPLRSRFGNQLTRLVFRALYGARLRDTQTGLRALPLGLLPALLRVAGERYEYESGVLIAAIDSRWPIEEIPIATIYLDGNSGSHFNAVLDSMRIYFVLLRFLLSSVLASVIDFLVFALALALGGSVLAGMVYGRGVALCVNFLVNKRLVFRMRGGGPGVFLRYLALVLLLGAMAYLGIRELQLLLGMPALLAKLLVESLLFVLSFSVQRAIVFADLRRDEGAAQ